MRARVVAYARRARAAGQSWHGIGGAVGVSAGSVQNWVGTPAPVRTLVAVAVAAPAPTAPAPPLVVVSPGGYRVEGLDLPTATTLLRALG